MALATPRGHLIDRLVAPRGRLTADAPLGPQTWFAAGGSAEVLFRPVDVEDLATFLAALPEDVPVTVPGVDTKLLDPRGAWADAAEYDKTARELVRLFADNFQQFVDYVDDNVKAAALVAA